MVTLSSKLCFMSCFIIVAVIAAVIYMFPFGRDLVKIISDSSFAKEVWVDDKSLFTKLSENIIIHNQELNIMRDILLDKDIGSRRFVFLAPFVKKNTSMKGLSAGDKTKLRLSRKKKFNALLELHKQGDEIILVEKAIEKFLLDTDLQIYIEDVAKDKQTLRYLSKLKGNQVTKLKERSKEQIDYNLKITRKREISNLIYNFFQNCSSTGQFYSDRSYDFKLGKLFVYDENIKKLIFDKKKIDVCFEAFSILIANNPEYRSDLISSIVNMYRYLYYLPAELSVQSALSCVDENAQKYLCKEIQAAVKIYFDTKIGVDRIESRFKVDLQSLRVSIAV